jgi:hypothetical protein
MALTNYGSKKYKKKVKMRKVSKTFRKSPRNDNVRIKPY